MNDTIHTRIKESRLELGLSQEDLARLVGVSREAISQWEKGKTTAKKPKPTKPNGKNLIKLSKALNRNPEWLETGKGIKEYSDTTKEMSKQRESNYGWICPICHHVNAPHVQSCPYPHEKN